VKRFRLIAITLLSVTAIISFFSLETRAATAGQNVDLKARMDKIVESYRKIIVLLDDNASLKEEERSRSIFAGRKIYHEKQQMVDELAESLGTELRKAVATRYRQKHANLDTFIDYLMKNPDLRDADRLALFDVADELLSITQEEEHSAGIKKSSSLHRSLQKLNDELKSIQSTYQEEVARIFSLLESRGKEPKREKWQEYVSFLKGFLKREQILAEYGGEKMEEPDEILRGARRDTKEEVFGYDLPPKSVVLTFDDGPHRRYTDEILAILKKYGIKAAFFNVGSNLGVVDEKANIKLAPTAAVSKRILESGHLLANHSYSHPDLRRLGAAQRSKEIVSTNLLLEKIIGAKPILFRPPYGAKNPEVLKDIEAQGLRSVMWNLDSLDWADPIPESVAQRVLKEIHEEKKGILLMHDIHKQSVAALPRILDELIKEDYTFLILQDGQFVSATSRSSGEARPAQNAADTNRQTTESPKKNFYRESWAVVIGINDYQNWPKLRYCVNDANSIEEILINKYGFKKSNIIKLLNEEATRERIVLALGDQLANPNKINKDDRVFVFFAGHGATRKLPSGKELGYIVPVDAGSDVSQAKSISMSQLQEFCELIPAKHLYFIIDSCYSGLALTRGGGASRSRNYLEEITKRTARQILTAGGADQQVADNGPGGHSVFTWTLLQGLQGLADVDGNGAITASELGAYIGPIVSSVSKQTPAFGNLIGSEGGEFIFELQQESLTEISKQLDDEAIKLNDELESVQKEIAEKRERNLKLRQKLEEERAKLATTTALRGAGGVTAPRTQTAQAQNHHNMGLKFYREKKYDEALAELDQAIKLDPKNATIVNNYGFTLYKMERYQESIEWFLKTINIDQNRALAYVNLADAYLKLDKKKEARQNYEKYLQLAPQSSRLEEIQQKIEELKDK
jgi:peptidoglycan/xylan/chitin deacetylase (PgdA/CDA1 family)/uncharacterized caspase-like protein